MLPLQVYPEFSEGHTHTASLPSAFQQQYFITAMVQPLNCINRLKRLKMKRIMLLMAGYVFCSQLPAQTISITVQGNRNRQVIVDNKTYDIQNNTTSNLSKTITLTDLRPGQYRFDLVRINDYNVNDDNIPVNDNTIPFVKTTTTFNVKAGFDVAIIVAPNGIVQVKEKQIAGTTSDPMITMNDEAFATLLGDIRYHWRNTRKITAAQTAFTNNNNYFTAVQAMQIINTVEGDENRLALARIAYNRITDQANFVQVYDLISSPSIRNDLSSFIRNQVGSNVIYSYSETFHAAMNEQTFDALLVNIKTNMDPSTRVNTVTEMMANQTNYFTVAQVRRLLDLVEFEGARLQLLKNVFTHITDVENFPLLYNLLTTDVSKIELINHVRTAVDNGGLINYNLNKPAMSGEAFSRLMNNAREQIAAGNSIAFLTNAFADISNYFTAQQAMQVISLAEGELSRLSLAKTAYRGITDPWNFLLLMDNLLYSPAVKNEMSIYAYSYRPM
jgi:hypothetical protein